MTRDGDSSTLYQVVSNDEKQYSIWPADRPLPDGWHLQGVTGTKDECLDHIENVWTDMRPLSLQMWMGSMDSSEG
jgi:MbtH protein